jgi:diketogulonate reductase-like aldo/keto reductase
MSLKTNNGVDVPSFMYGTAWKKSETTSLVELAVKSGFTAIDTANQLVHYDEALVGQALLNLQKSGIGREQLFLQTKFTSVDGQRGQTPYDAKAPLTEQVNQSFASSLEHLHTDYLDSYVLHGPYERYHFGASDWEVWRAMETIYKTGKTRMIGVSNVTADQLDELCVGAAVKPAMVQNRCYAITGWDADVRRICREHGIIYQGFSLLTANVDAINGSPVRAIANRLNAGVAQVVFRFAMQVGMLPLTGTSSEQHMRDDLAAEQLSLTDEDVKTIESILSGVR